MTCQHDIGPLKDGICWCDEMGCCNAEIDGGVKCICRHPGHYVYTNSGCGANHPEGWQKDAADGPAAGPDRAPTAAPSPAGAQDMNAYTWHDPEDVVLVRTSADGPVIAYGVRR